MDLLNDAENAYVLNIQHYSLHDGPGIRTLVFLKGCPLSCKWCSNPESQKPYPEIAYNNLKCIGEKECRECIKVCSNAISYGDDGKVIVNYKSCRNCLDCVDVCPSKALTSYGKRMSYKEILGIVERNEGFFNRSSGGLTLSGGEPLLRGDFTINLLREAKKRRINTAIETCGFLHWDVLKEAAKYLDTIIFDIKCIGEDKHKKFTGVSNKLILSNFKRLCSEYPKLKKLVRTPVIPGFNNNENDISEIILYLSDEENISYELLPYHRLGEQKYRYIGREYELGNEKLDEKLMDNLQNIVSERV